MFPGAVFPVSDSISIGFDNLEVLWLDFEDYKVESWYIPPTNNALQNSHPLMIIAHGNAEFIDNWYSLVGGLLDRGIGVLLVEYPGYNRSGGKPSQKSIREVYLRAYDLMAERPDIDSSRIVLFGRSIGTGVICDLSELRPSCGMILLSGFTGTKAFASRYFLPGILARDPFDNIEAVRKYSNPLMIFHAVDDDVIPYQHSVKLKAAASDCELITFDSGGHNQCITDWDDFWYNLDGFFKKVGAIQDVQ